VAAALLIVVCSKAEWLKNIIEAGIRGRRVRDMKSAKDVNGWHNFSRILKGFVRGIDITIFEVFYLNLFLGTILF